MYGMQSNITKDIEIVCCVGAGREIEVKVTNFKELDC